MRHGQPSYTFDLCRQSGNPGVSLVPDALDLTLKGHAMKLQIPVHLRLTKTVFGCQHLKAQYSS